MDFDAEMLGVFVASCQEQLADIESHVLTLERGDGIGCVDAIFRAAHSIKADAAAMGLARLADFAHAVEDVLHLVRAGRLDVSTPLIEALLAAFDSLRRMALDPARQGDLDVSPALMALGRVLSGALSAGVSGAATGEDRPGRPDEAERDRPLVSDTMAHLAQVSVPAAKLDQLVDHLGELVALQARLDDRVRHGRGVAAVVNDLNSFLDGLRDRVMDLRLVSLRPVFAKLRRLIRDTAAQTGKQVGLVVSGEDTLLDKSVVEHVWTPLAHIVRNAVDHGIEAPLVRAGGGRNPEGRIEVRARQIGGEVEILVRDDGRGMDRDTLARRAVETGLLASVQAASGLTMTDLACLPGLSTAERVGPCSGRGVGMDAARAAISGLRGALDIRSVVGRGTEVRVRVPLSLAMLDCLHVVIGADSFFIPLPSVEECLDIRHDTVTVRRGRGMTTLRGAPLSVLCPASWWGLSRKVSARASLVVVRAGRERLGLIVDEIVGHRQIVLKQISRAVGRLDGFLGGAVTEAGTMALVLDVPVLVRLGLAGTGPDEDDAKKRPEVSAESHHGEDGTA